MATSGDENVVKEEDFDFKIPSYYPSDKEVEEAREIIKRFIENVETQLGNSVRPLAPPSPVLSS